MAKVRFLKHGEISQKKKDKPQGTFRKRWKIAFFISGLINVVLLYFMYFNRYCIF